MHGTLLMRTFTDDPAIYGLGRDISSCEIYLNCLEKTYYTEKVRATYNSIMQMRLYLAKVAGRSASLLHSYAEPNDVVKTIENMNKKTGGVKKAFDSAEGAYKEKVHEAELLHKFSDLCFEMSCTLSYFTESAYAAYLSSKKIVETDEYGIEYKEFDPEVFKKEYAGNLVATSAVMPYIAKPAVEKGMVVVKEETTGD